MANALLVIDCQMEFARRTAAGQPRSNPLAETAIAETLAQFRAAGMPIVHIHHDDPRPTSRFRIGTPGGVVMPCAAPLPPEAVFIKTGSSAFIGTDLAAHLQASGITHLVVIGAAVNYCVSSSVRMAANLGFAVTVVQDAVFGFGITGPDGLAHNPATVLSVTLGTLADFAAIVSSSDVMERL
jgi:nicotinamidase-related amidase